MSSTKTNKPTEAQIKLANRQQELTDKLVPMIVSVDFGTANSCIGVGDSNPIFLFFCINYYSQFLLVYRTPKLCLDYDTHVIPSMVLYSHSQRDLTVCGVAAKQKFETTFGIIPIQNFKSMLATVQ